MSSPDWDPLRRIGIQPGWHAFLLLLVTAILPQRNMMGADAGNFPVASGLEVAVLFHFDRSPAISRTLRDDIEKRVALTLRTMIGSGVQILTESPETIDRWLERNAVHQLTAATCRKLGADKHEKSIVVSVKYAGGTFDLTAGEYDRHFDHFGPVSDARIVQRDMVCEAVARMVANCWTPVGQINAFRDGRFVIGFPNLPRLLSASNLSGLTKGSVLQLFRETISGNQLRQDAHPSQFLLVESAGAKAVVASPIGDSWDRDWFQYLGDSQARYLVRRVAPRTGTSRVQVFLSGTVADQPDVLVPRGGCDVYLHDQPSPRLKTNTDVIAVTQRNGIAELPIEQAKPVFLTVAYENQSLTQPFIRGVSPEPVVFQFRYLGNRGDYINSLKVLHDRLRANAAKINQLVATISSKAEDADPQTIRQLSNEALELANVDALVGQAEAIEQAAADENLDLTESMKSVRRTIDDMNVQTARLRSDMAKAERFSAAQRSLEAIQAKFDAMQWAEALTLMQRFAVEFPEHPQAARLAAFQKAAAAVDSAHTAARQQVLKADAIKDIAALESRWPEIRRAIDRLIAQNDALYLANVNAMRDRWQQLVNDEIQSIKADNVTAASLQGAAQDAAVASLKQRVAALGPVRQDLEQLGPQILAEAQRSKGLLGGS